MSSPHRMFASCAPGLEALLAREVDALGGLDVKTEPGGVAFAGHRAVLYRVNRRSGLATHVLLRLGAVRATSFSVLVAELARLDWPAWLRPGVPRKLRVHAKKCKLYHTDAIAERAGRAIAQALGDGLEAPDPGGVPILIRGLHDRFECSLDTSGEPLHRRGYRLDPGPAPLREDLAHALIVASRWDRERPFVDPFAGAGTLAIEAARLASGIDPGAARGFAFERTPLFHDETWRRVVDEATPRPAPLIVASDRDPGAVTRTLANAARAGVSESIDVRCASVSEVDLGALEGGGALVTHPPFGGRMDAGRDLAPLYRALGARVAALPPSLRLALYCTDPALGHRVAEGLTTAFVTDAGGVKIRALVRPVEPLSLERGEAEGDQRPSTRKT